MVVSKQAELNRQRELEEMMQQKEVKEGYKQDLQFQQQMRSIEVERTRRLKDEDARDVDQRSRQFQLEAERRRLDDAQQKKALAEDYQRHQEFQRQKEAEERQRKLREEQEQMERVRQQIESDSRRKKEFKSIEAQREQDVLNHRRSLEQAQRQATISEKLYEQKLSQDYIEREDRKEQERREYYQRIHMAQREKVNQHLQTVTSMQQEKDMQVSQWIVENQEQYQKRLADKEEMERRIRLAAIQETNQTLRLQMEEKERQKQFAKEEARRQQEETSQKIAANKQWEEQRVAERKQQQAYYRDVLAAQSSVSQDLKLASSKLTDHERLLNRNLLASGPRSTLQTSAVQVLKSTTALDPEPVPKPFNGTFDRNPKGGSYPEDPTWSKEGGRLPYPSEAPGRRFPDPAADPTWARDSKPAYSGPGYDQNERNFYGDDGTDGSTGRPAMGQLRGGSYDAGERHNPISNPVGSRPPVPGDRPLYRARRAVF